MEERWENSEEEQVWPVGANEELETVEVEDAEYLKDLDTESSQPSGSCSIPGESVSMGINSHTVVGIRQPVRSTAAMV